MNRAFVLIGGFFLSFGLLCAGIGGWIYLTDQKIADTGIATQGTVIELDRKRDSDGDNSYRLIVEFYDAGGTRHEFIADISSNPPAYARGETVPIIYDPAAPARAMVNNFTDRYLLPMVFCGIGCLGAAIGAALLFLVWHRRKIIERLKRSGMGISGKFLECYRDTNSKVNERSPYRVVAQATHPATGKLESFKSDPIRVDLSEELSGEELTILVDPANPNHHYVDLSSFV